MRVGLGGPAGLIFFSLGGFVDQFHLSFGEAVQASFFSMSLGISVFTEALFVRRNQNKRKVGEVSYDNAYLKRYGICLGEPKMHDVSYQRREYEFYRGMSQMAQRHTPHAG